MFPLQYRGAMTPELLKEFIANFLGKLDIEFESITVTQGHRTVVAVQTPHSKLLIGPHGEHLRALNTLVRSLAGQKSGEQSANFLVDVNNYHEEQMEKVRQSARMLAQRARLFKRDVEMEPMSSYERLVVHELFAEDPQIQTVSAGEGKFRHIVFKCK